MVETDMFRLVIFSVLFVNVLSGKNDGPELRVVKLEEGAVEGRKYWNGDFYEFYGIPYATAPTGRDVFKAPLPVKPRDKILEATDSNIMCQQVFYTGEVEDDIYMSGVEDCLVLNVLVPEVASEKNLLPVVVYTHSGAFSGGSGTMAKLNFLARHDVIAISFNYRVGAIGFACLGTEEIPGNAALKDQLAALKWINKNIEKFGGDPKRVTLAGYSVGATMAELMALSKQSVGLFDKLILESGSALAPFAINRDPIGTAKNIATSLGFKDTGDLKDLNEFYLKLTVEYKELADKSLNFFLPNSTFGFAPCIEDAKNNSEAIITESPLEVLKRKDIRPLAVLTGFSNMEGLSRSAKFGEWRELINENFLEFMPADLTFENDEIKQEVANKIHEYYFKGQKLTKDSLREYVDFFSDIMFKYPILKSAKLHSGLTSRPVYFYEFSYVGSLNMQHFFTGRLEGASHRDQSAYVLDFLAFTDNFKDMDTRDRLTSMWTDFIKYENPTAYESSLLSIKWKPFTNDKPNYLSIGSSLDMKRNIVTDSYKFLDKLYNKYYWTPKAINNQTN